MLEALIGIAIGIALCTFIFLLDAHFASKGNTIAKRIERPVQAHFRPKGAVIDVPDEVTLSRHELLKKNQEEGRDTRLEDIL